MPFRVRGNLLLVVGLAMISACGGGGGGSSAPPPPPPAPSITYSATDFSFNVAAPYSPTPPNQTITATVTGVTSGTLYITVVENNPELATVENIAVTSTTSGQAMIVPATPGTLAPGTYQGSFVLTACLNDPTCKSGQLSGSPQTITLHYTLGSNVVADSVTPRVVPSNIPGTVILRGHGFAAGQTVMFGSTAIPAASVSFVGESQLTVSYPALPSGGYPISVNSGSVSYSASLSVVDPTSYTPVLLSYGGITPTSIASLEYDAERRALLVLVNTSTQPALLRYAFDGTNWSSPTQVTIADLQQVHLSADGTKVLGIVSPATQQASFVELDSTTLGQTASTVLPTSVATNFPGGGPPSAWFSLANDGNAIVVLYSYSYNGAPVGGPENSFALVFNTSVRTYALMGLEISRWNEIAPVSSGDGSLVEFGWEYSAFHGAATPNENVGLGGLAASADLTADKIVMPNQDPFAPAVFSSGFPGSVLGRLPQALGTVINRAGTRVYLVEAADNMPDVHIFDVTTSPGPNSQYSELTPPILLAGDPGIGSPVAPLLTISMDGGTVFVAGANGVAVQPVP